MKTYYMTRRQRRPSAQVISQDGRYKSYLRLRKDVVHHSDQYDWGSTGAGAAQLALDLLADAVGAEFALEFHQSFKWEVVSRRNTVEWEITEEEIKEWARNKAARVNPAAGLNVL